MNKFFIIPLHSEIDIITNSSTEVFITSKQDRDFPLDVFVSCFLKDLVKAIEEYTTSGGRIKRIAEREEVILDEEFGIGIYKKGRTLSFKVTDEKQFIEGFRKNYTFNTYSKNNYEYDESVFIKNKVEDGDIYIVSPFNFGNEIISQVIESMGFKYYDNEHF